MAHSLLTLCLLAAVWALLVRGDVASWLVGLPVVVAATWSVAVLRAQRWPAVSLAGAMRFAAFFLVESARGGVDVARRVMGARVRVAPGFVDYRLRLRSADARLLFVNCVCLLPGTLVADTDGDAMKVHTLDRATDSAADLRRVEREVGRVFGEQL